MQITNIAAKLDLTAYAGDFVDDYDMDAVHADYVSALNCELPVGITLYANGDVIAEVEFADKAREIDWDDLTNRVPADGIFERHDKTAQRFTAILGGQEQAFWLAGMGTVVGSGHRVDVEGATVTLTGAALAVLAELPADHDGHYDGKHIWIGGTEYAVTAS